MNQSSAEWVSRGRRDSAAPHDVLADLESQRRASGSHGPGRWPALLVIDAQPFFFAGSDDARQVLHNIADTVAVSRRGGIPIFFARVVYDDLQAVDPAWRARFDLTGLLRHEASSEFVGGLGVTAADLIVEKRHASAFRGALADGVALDDALTRRGVDTLLVVGASTSGCVRATAVDGAALGYRVLVIEEAVFDARLLSGAVALADLQDRYADVVSLAQATDYVNSVAEVPAT